MSPARRTEPGVRRAGPGPPAKGALRAGRGWPPCVTQQRWGARSVQLDDDGHSAAPVLPLGDDLPLTGGSPRQPRPARGGGTGSPGPGHPGLPGCVTVLRGNRWLPNLSPENSCCKETSPALGPRGRNRCVFFASYLQPLTGHLPGAQQDTRARCTRVSLLGNQSWVVRLSLLPAGDTRPPARAGGPRTPEAAGSFPARPWRGPVLPPVRAACGVRHAGRRPGERVPLGCILSISARA